MPNFIQALQEAARANPDVLQALLDNPSLNHAHTRHSYGSIDETGTGSPSWFYTQERHAFPRMASTILSHGNLHGEREGNRLQFIHTFTPEQAHHVVDAPIFNGLQSAAPGAPAARRLPTLNANQEGIRRQFHERGATGYPWIAHHRNTLAEGNVWTHPTDRALLSINVNHPGGTAGEFTTQDIQQVWARPGYFQVHTMHPITHSDNAFDMAHFFTDLGRRKGPGARSALAALGGDPRIARAAETLVRRPPAAAEPPTQRRRTEPLPFKPRTEALINYWGR